MSESIGERIKRLRKARSLSQTDLAARLGVSQPAVANWESGMHDPRRLMLAKLAVLLQVPLDWLAEGYRSSIESDSHGAAAYLRRPQLHVPVVSFQNVARFATQEDIDLHLVAEDYIPVTTSSTKMFGLFLVDDAVALDFPMGTLVVIDYADKNPAEESFCLALRRDPTGGGDDELVIRRWRSDPPRLEAASALASYKDILVDQYTQIIGCVRVSIRFH